MSQGQRSGQFQEENQSAGHMMLDQVLHLLNLVMWRSMVT